MVPSNPFSSHFGVVGDGVEQQIDNVSLSLEQQLVLHQAEGNFESSVPPMNMIPVSSATLGYWPADQQPLQHPMLPAGFCPPPPPPPHHLPPQAQQCPNPSLINGDIAPMTVFFSPPYPYHQVSN